MSEVGQRRTPAAVPWMSAAGAKAVVFKSKTTNVVLTFAFRSKADMTITGANFRALSEAALF